MQAPCSRPFPMLVSLAACAALAAQESQPGAAKSDRVVFPKHELSLVPPAGWSAERGNDDDTSDRRSPLLSCDSPADGGPRVRLRVYEAEPVVVLNARAIADRVAGGRKPPWRVLEAKDLRAGGSAAGLILYEITEVENGEKKLVALLSCLVQGPKTTLVLEVGGPPEVVARQRAAVEGCQASVRLGKWALPGARFPHPRLPLSLVPPDGWREVPETSPDAWTFAVPSDDKLRPRLTVRSDLTPKDAAPSVYRATLVNRQKRTAKDFQCVDLRDVTVGGKKGSILRCKLTQDGAPLLQLHYLMQNEARPFVLVWTCREADLAGLQAPLDACLASVELGKEDAGKPAKR